MGYKMIYVLPKRSDDIYQEIENFEDYELTNCVAYEMAVRNDEVIRLKKFLDKRDNLSNIPNKKNDEKKTFSSWKHHMQLVKKYPALSNELVKKMVKQKLKKSFYINHYFNNEKEIGNGGLFSLQYNDKLYTEGLLSHMNSSLDKLSCSSRKHSPKLKMNVLYKDGYIIRQAKYDYNKDYSLSEIKTRFKRKLYCDKLTKSLNVELNLALPKKELIAFIENIKDEYDKDNSIVKTPLELLGETLNGAVVPKNYPKKLTAAKMADMFYIYDYVKVRLKEVSNANINIKAAYKEQIADVSKNKDLTTKEKKIQKAELFRVHCENTIDTTIKDIFNEEKLKKMLNLKEDNISKLYYAIKPYIDNLKYKELVTGVSTI